MSRVLEVVLNAEGTVGGEQRHVLQIVDALLAAGHEPAVVTWDVPAFLDELSARGVPVTVVMGTRILDPGMVRRIRDVVSDGGFDLVHAHGHRAGLVGRLAALRAGCRRVVWTCHLAENKADRNPVLAWGYERVLRYLHRRTGATIAVSEHLRHWLSGEGIEASDVVVVPNGVDCDVFAPRPRDEGLATELGLDLTCPVVVCVARLTPQKGVDTLVKASARLQDSGLRHTVLVVGAGPDDAAVRSLASRSLAPVVFAGERGDIPEVLALADVVTVPSLWEGAFCFSVLEAFACAKPVVCSDIEIFVDVVAGRDVARVFSAGDEESLASELAAVIADADGASRMGERARELVRTHYSVESMQRATLAIYEGLLGGERS